MNDVRRVIGLVNEQMAQDDATAVAAAAADPSELTGELHRTQSIRTNIAEEAGDEVLGEIESIMHGDGGRDILEEFLPHRRTQSAPAMAFDLHGGALSGPEIEKFNTLIANNMNPTLDAYSTALSRARLLFSGTSFGAAFWMGTVFQSVANSYFTAAFAWIYYIAMSIWSFPIFTGYSLTMIIGALFKIYKDHGDRFDQIIGAENCHKWYLKTLLLVLTLCEYTYSGTMDLLTPARSQQTLRFLQTVMAGSDEQNRVIALYITNRWIFHLPASELLDHMATPMPATPPAPPPGRTVGEMFRENTRIQIEPGGTFAQALVFFTASGVAIDVMRRTRESQETASRMIGWNQPAGTGTLERMTSDDARMSDAWHAAEYPEEYHPGEYTMDPGSP